MTGKLAGKRVLITGAAGGIGQATLRRFALEGARIAATDITPLSDDAARDTASDITFLTHDVSDPVAWDRVIDEAVTKLNGLDVLVNNAAYLADAPLIDLEEEDFRRHIDINLIGAWLGMQAAAKVMISGGNGGVIVNISSVSGMIGHPNRGAYGATKWAIRGLTRTAALEWAPHGIRVCAVIPGPIDTPMSRRARGYPPNQPLAGMILPDIPLQRFGSADEVAAAIAYLSSAEANYVTGSELVVDGGCLLNR